MAFTINAAIPSAPAVKRALTKIKIENQNMKTSLRLLFTVLALAVGATTYAQGPGGRGHFGPPPGTVNSDGTITLPDGTVFTPPDININSDGTITLPDGTTIDPSKDLPPPHEPPVKNTDGSLTLPDGAVVQPNADGTYTLPDGHVIDLTKAPPAGGPGGRGGHRGPPPSGK